MPPNAFSGHIARHCEGVGHFACDRVARVAQQPANSARAPRPDPGTGAAHGLSAQRGGGALALHKRAGLRARPGSPGLVEPLAKGGELRGYAEFDRYWQGATRRRKNSATGWKNSSAAANSRPPAWRKSFRRGASAAFCCRLIRWASIGAIFPGSDFRPCASGVRCRPRVSMSSPATRWPTPCSPSRDARAGLRADRVCHRPRRRRGALYKAGFHMAQEWVDRPCACRP